VVAAYLNPPRGKEFRSPHLLPVPIIAGKATTHPAGIWLAVPRNEKRGNSVEIRRLLLPRQAIEGVADGDEQLTILAVRASYEGLL